MLLLAHSLLKSNENSRWGCYIHASYQPMGNISFDPNLWKGNIYIYFHISKANLYIFFHLVPAAVSIIYIAWLQDILHFLSFNYKKFIISLWLTGVRETVLSTCLKRHARVDPSYRNPYFTWHIAFFPIIISIVSNFYCYYFTIGVPSVGTFVILWNITLLYSSP